MAYIYRVRLYDKNLDDYKSTSFVVPYPESFIKKYKIKHGLKSAFITAGALGNYLAPLAKVTPSNNPSTKEPDFIAYSQGISASITALKGKKGEGIVLGVNGQLPEKLKIGKNNILYCDRYHENTGKMETLLNNSGIEHVPNSTEFFIASDLPPESVSLKGLTSGVLFDDYEDAHSFLILTKNKNTLGEKINAFKNDQTLETITDKVSQVMQVYSKIHQKNGIKISQKDMAFLMFNHSLMQHDDLHVRLLAILGILQQKESKGLKEMVQKCLPPGFDTYELISQELIRLVKTENPESNITQSAIDVALKDINSSVASGSIKKLPFEKISGLYELLEKNPKKEEDYQSDMLHKKDFSNEIMRTVKQFETAMEKYETEGNKTLLKHKPTKDMVNVYKQLLSSENPINKMIGLYGIINYKDPYENRAERLSGDYWHNTLTSRVIKQYNVNVWHTPTPLKLLIEKKLGNEAASKLFKDISNLNTQIASGQLDGKKAADELKELISNVDKHSGFTPTVIDTKKQFIDSILKDPKKLIDRKRNTPSDSTFYQIISSTPIIDYINTIGGVRAECYHLMIHDKDPFINLIGLLGILQDTKDKNAHASVALRGEMIALLPQPLNTVQGMQDFISGFIGEKNIKSKNNIMDIIRNNLNYFNQQIAQKWSNPQLFSTATTIKEVKKFINDIKNSGFFDPALLEKPLRSENPSALTSKTEDIQSTSPATGRVTTVTTQYKDLVDELRSIEEGKDEMESNSMKQRN